MAAGARRLVGRREEIDLIEHVLRASTGSRSIVLGGSAGVGKTRLAQEVADRWSAARRPVEWISGTAGSSTIPFGAVARLLPDLGPLPQRRDVDVIRATVAAIGARPDLLVVVDDGHSLDDLSALLVQHLILDRGVGMLVTVRNGEAMPPALSALWRDHHAERIDVLPLSEPEAEVLAADVVGGQLTPETGAALFAASQGNPLLLGELVHDAIDSGGLRHDGDGWRWDGRIGRGRHLRDAMGGRIDALGPSGRRLVSVLALAEPLEAPLVRALVPDLDLDEAEDRGLVHVRVDDTRVQCHLGHPLLGELVRAERDAAGELDVLRLEIADALRAGGRGHVGDRLLEARLRLDAGDGSDPELLLSAAQRLILVGAPSLGEQMALAAAACEGAPPLARVVAAEALIFQRREVEAAAVFEAALPSITDDAELVRAAFSAQSVLQGLGRRDDIERMNADVATRVTDPVWRAVFEGNVLQLRMMTGETRWATARGEELLAENDDPRVLLRLVSSVSSGRALAGKSESAIAFVSEMLPDALRLQAELPLAPAWVMNAQALALLVAGRLRDAVGLIEMLRVLTSGEAAVGADQAVWLNLYTGRIDMLRGRVAPAADLVRVAADGFGSDDPGGFNRWARSIEVEALAVLGRLDEAEAAFEHAMSSATRMTIYEGDARRSRAWLWAQRGELGRAIDELMEVAALQQLEGQYGLELYTLHDVVRLGGVAEAGDRLVEVAGEVDGRWADPCSRHVRALRADDGAELEAVGEAFASMDAVLHGAEAMAEAARAHESAGLRTRAAGALRRRDDLLGETGGARTPALLDLPSRAQLTRREREVVELAARGLSNKDIAGQLFVSLRTAEGHLYRAFTKLGVEDRSELPDVLGNR